MLPDIGAAAAVVLALVALAVVGFAWFAAKTRFRGTTDSRLGRLTSLSKTTAMKEAIGLSNWRDVLTDSLELARRAHTYCCVTLHKDILAERLNDRDHIAIQWRIDCVRPNRYLVTQEAWDAELGELSDQWISIGPENYQNSGFWIRTDDGRNAKLNQSLSLDVMLDVVESLRTADPGAVGVYKHLKDRFLLLEFDNPASREGPLAMAEVLADGSCHVHVWINLAAGSFSKAQVIFRGTTAAGKLIDVEVQKVFTCYNEKVSVKPPPWLNAVPVEGGKFKIVNTRVPIIRHYGSSRALQPRITRSTGPPV